LDVSIRAVLFDWGGTLVRDDSLVVTAPTAAVAHYARQTLSLALRNSDFEHVFQEALPPYVQGQTLTVPRLDHVISAAFRALGWSVGESDIEECCRLFFEEAMSTHELFDDARAILASLRYRGYRIGVVTNSIFPSHLFVPKLKELGIAGYVDAVISSSDVGRGKPDPAPFLAALKLLGADPHEAIFVGDSLDSDIAGARAAGMRSVLIDRRGKKREGAGYLVVQHLGALNDFLGEGVVLWSEPPATGSE
jgi:HAD superfamily hydrolase (TIGR01509 family)